MAIIKRPGKAGISYQVKLRDNWGDWFQSQTFTDAAEADGYHADLVALKVKGVKANTDSDLEGVDANAEFQDFVALWKKECRGDVSLGWQKSQDQMLRDYCKPLTGSQLANIGPREIASLLAAVKAKGRSAGMVNHVYTMLHTIFTDAIEHFGMKISNPVLRRYKLKKHKKPVARLHPDESRTLLEHVRGHWLGPAIWVGILTGLRPCEIQTLEWKHIRWDLRDIQILTSFKRKENREQDQTKQGDAGLAAMPEMLAEYLSERRDNGSKYVCPAKRGGRLNYSYFNSELKTLCEAAGVTIVTAHKLRHSATEMLVEKGATQTDVQRQLNHKSISTTQGYMHRTNERLQSIVSNVGRPNLTLVIGNTENVPTEKERAS